MEMMAVNNRDIFKQISPSKQNYVQNLKSYKTL